MFYRKYEEDLKKWKEKNITTPLLVIGARQVGKTYTIDKFCKEYFENYIYINLDRESHYIDMFDSDLNPERIIKQIEAYRMEKIDIDKTIFFFDEVQVSERFISSLKYFCESDKPYKIICAGSLLGVKVNRFTSSFPVGKVSFLYMYGMDFEEFLLATNNELLNKEIEESFKNNRSLPEALHKKALDLYYRYLYIGGMPNVVLDYIQNNQDIVVFNREKQGEIITAYLGDMAKYAQRSETVKTIEIYNSIPKQLSREKNKFTYKLVNKRAKSRNYSSSVSWLLDAGLLLRCIRVSKVEKPLKLFEELNYFKLYLNDVGLLCYLSNYTYYDIIYSEGSTFRGILAENYVAQTLKRNKHDLYYHKVGYEMEIDFIVKIDNNIIPIEVKAGTNTKSRSLTSYLKSNQAKYAIRISGKNFGFKNNIKSIPLYATHLIKNNV